VSDWSRDARFVVLPTALQINRSVERPELMKLKINSNIVHPPTAARAPGSARGGAMLRRDCRLIPLACGDGCRVDRCEHGTFHLTIGGLTLRLSEEALCTLADTLRHARLELGRPGAAGLPC
jgi:hypothetical protein